MEYEEDEEPHFLDTVEGEISFFRSLMRTRPVGIHRHFHVLAMRNSIHRDTGHWIAADDIWEKLRSCYDLDILESIVSIPPCCYGQQLTSSQETEGYDTPGGNGSNSPEHNLAVHPYFGEGYTLPHDEAIENMISRRRMRDSVSLPSSSPEPTSPVVEKTTRSSKKAKTKSSLAGLVGGESDSSALTQESGDESISPPPRLGSVATGTDAGTEYAEDEEDTETQSLLRHFSLLLAISSSSATAKNTRKGKSIKKLIAASRKRGTSVSRGAVKKRKR